jgi:putative hemolysin
MSLDQIIEVFVTSGYSRIPVYEGTIEQIIGVLYNKDAFAAYVEKSDVDLKSLVRPAVFVVETAPGDDVMVQFRQMGTHLALVVGEYGQVIGLVTLEDLLEELVGEIRDESDASEERPFVKRDDGSWLIDGLQPYDKVSKVIGMKDDGEEDFTSIAGTIMSKLGRVPAVGDMIRIDDFILEVVDMDGRRVDKVLIRQEKPEANSD